LPSAPSLAQTATQPAATQPTATPQSSSGIEEVIVTATRRSELLSKVPQSISAFTTEKMDQLNAKSIADLVAFTPGVNLRRIDKNVSIRGVNSDAGDATTGIYIDDTQIQLRTLGFGSDNTLPAVFDLDRVESCAGRRARCRRGLRGRHRALHHAAAKPHDYSVYAKSELSGTQDGA